MLARHGELCDGQTVGILFGIRQPTPCDGPVKQALPVVMKRLPWRRRLFTLAEEIARYLDSVQSDYTSTKPQGGTMT